MVLELKSVGKVYARGSRMIVALDGASLTVDAGDCVALYGSSRSGKSTLLRLAAGAELASFGSVLYEGRDLAGLGDRRRSRLLRSEVAWMPAAVDFHPGLQVLDQVALSGYVASRDYARSRREAAEALRKAGIEHCADARPSELSDGELRLAGIAQAIVKRPRLLLADDPASKLDPMERDHVLDLLRACSSEQGTAVLFSANHADETLRSTGLARLDAGRLTVPSEPGRGEVITFPRRAGTRSHA